MKKLLVTIGALLIIASASYAEMSTTVISATSQSNLLANSFLSSGSVKISSILVSSASQAGTVTFIDTPDGTRSWTNASYNVISSYATNLVTSYTNYFGVVNTFTNLALIETTNTVAQSTNAWYTPVAVSFATNTPVSLTGISQYFRNGIYATNSSASAVTVTLTYQR